MTSTTRAVRKSKTHVRTNAGTVVRRCLQNAAERLREAADGELSRKSLHELRIACRRAEAALCLCEDAADSRAWRWLRQRLKTLRRSCNPARDDDVLLKWIKRHDGSSSRSVQRAIRAHRKEVQPQIGQLAKRLSKDHRFEQRSREVVKRLQTFERSGRAAQAFGRRLFDEVHRFLKSLPSGRDDAAALHRLRIVGKRLRYVCELVTEIWPDVELSELREHLHSLQDQLGAIHDQVVGERYLQKQLPAKLTRTIQPLVRKAQSTATRLQRKFWRWWQAYAVERMLADTTAEVVTLMRK